MTEKKRPIQRSIIVGCAVFILVLCLMLSAQSYLQFSNALYRQCQLRLSEVISYVEEHIDEEDLNRCIIMRQTSETRIAPIRIGARVPLPGDFAL